eukprot:SAG31_NODE_33967_length_338_cov_0.841004_1_plen_57_part_10
MRIAELASPSGSRVILTARGIVLRLCSTVDRLLHDYLSPLAAALYPECWPSTPAAKP